MSNPITPLLFGVLSDLHLLDPALGLPEGAARSELVAPGPFRFSVAPANAWGQEGAAHMVPESSRRHSIADDRHSEHW